MRVSRKKALENIKAFHATVKKLTSLTDGKVKQGMLKMVENMIGTKLRLVSEDIVKASEMTEEEFIDYAGPKLYPSCFQDKKKKEERENKDVVEQPEVDNTTIAITNIGKVLVNICQKTRHNHRLSKAATRTHGRH